MILQCVCRARITRLSSITVAGIPIKSFLASCVSNPTPVLTTEPSASGQMELKDDRSRKSTDSVDAPANKKLKSGNACDDDPLNNRKKKVAMLLVYSGKGYLGMQRNQGFKTIESDLLDALVKAGVVRPDHIEQPGVKMAFQRAARTDKGVSAAGQVVSLKMLVGTSISETVESINNNLPEQIRVLGIKRTTKGFDSKNTCDSRTYSYITPSFAFAPVETIVTEDYRITDSIRQRVGELLCLFTGTHNFHNFTSGKKPNDPSARRYIMHFTIGEPFVRNGIEFVKLTVRGQSFMLHQIRKMIGITIAIMRGMTGVESIERSWASEKTDVPKAPGVGLILNRLHYDAYNKKFGNDGMHEKIDWDEYQEQIDAFVENFIYPTIYDTEKNDKSMLTWLATLPLHHYDVVQNSLVLSTPLAMAHSLANPPASRQKISDVKTVQRTTDSVELELTASAATNQTTTEPVAVCDAAEEVSVAVTASDSHTNSLTAVQNGSTDS